MDQAEELEAKAGILVAVVAIHALLLMWLSSRRCRSGHRTLRFLLLGMSAAYFPLMSYVLSYLTTSLPSSHDVLVGLLLTTIVLIQFLKAKADMAALAVAAVASPAAGDDIDSLKIRPSMESLIYSFWVAGLVMYKASSANVFQVSWPLVLLLDAMLWTLGSCRMVLSFLAFRRAVGSFALRRNVQLIGGHMAHLQQGGSFEAAVPRLIVTGERNKDVEESPLGYRVKLSVPGGERRGPVTLDQVWSQSDPVLIPELKDLCLSFALFKCLRRRFAGYRLAEASSNWALHFVLNGLLGREDDYERIFSVIAGEISFASDFYYTPLPVASLGTVFAALHFFLSSLIFLLLCFLAFLVPILLHFSGPETARLRPTALLAFVLAVVVACTEILDTVAGVRSRWTKVSIVGRYVMCPPCSIRRIFPPLLRCKSLEHWKHEMGQMELLLNPSLLCEQPWSRLFKQLLHHRKRAVMIKISPDVKAAILSAFRTSGGQLSDGTAVLRRQCPALLAWCHGSEVATTTDAILVWCIATSLFGLGCSSRRASASSSVTAARMLVATSLSRYCAYLVAEAPDLLPGDPAWTKCRYEAVKKAIEVASRRSHAIPEADVFGHLVNSFSCERSHEVLNKGSRLAKQLVEVAEGPRGEEDEDEAGAETDDVVWELLAEFWSEMVLYLAPSDNVKGHLETLQRGGELITLLWALLLHAGIISRPARVDPEP